MKFYSPLRYPGGKNKLAKFVGLICEKNKINGHYVEPYAGGASVALFLLINGYVKRITINDIDRPIYAFWYSVLHRTDKFIQLIEKKPVNIKTWRECKKIQNSRKPSLLELGFSTFFLNRTNRSGILDAGPIGNLDQRGKYKIDCRYNKNELIDRVKEITIHKRRIDLEHLDAIDLIRKIKKQSRSTNTIFYFDPPYYFKGESLYFSHYKHKDHEKVCEEISKIKNYKWVVSYDYARKINKMYSKFRSKQYSLPHSAYKSRVGKEVLFFSDNLILPRVVSPVACIA
jgi:DNA adenine methylase